MRTRAGFGSSSAALTSGAALVRSELRGVELAAPGTPSARRGVRMPWVDVVNAAAELAEAVGIEIVD